MSHCIIIMEQKELEQKLLKLFNGNQEKYCQYTSLLSLCTKPADVANKVIGPMFIDGYISKDDISKKDYYGTLAELIEHYNGHHIAPQNLDYHITANLKKWKNEKEEAQKNEPFRQETRIRHNADGSMEIFNYVYMKNIPDNVSELLKPYIELGYAEVKKKVQRNFNARGEEEVMEIGCAAWLMPDVILTLKEISGDMTVDFKSHYIRQEQITLDEALEIIDSESDEEQKDL